MKDMGKEEWSVYNGFFTTGVNDMGSTSKRKKDTDSKKRK